MTNSKSNFTNENSAIKWMDYFHISKELVHLTYNELEIPGLRLFGMTQPRKAISPLDFHYHENAFEFSFIAQGEMHFYTQGINYNVPGGSVFVSYPNEPHSTNQFPMTPKTLFWFQLDISDPENILFLNPEAARRLIEDLYNIKKHMIATDTKTFSQLMKYIFKLAINEGKRSNIEIASCILIFLQRLIHFAKNESEHRSLDINLALTYIDEHLTEELALEDIAKQCTLSLPQFKLKFKNSVGTSPRDYINKNKIEYSKKLLREGTSITDTAMQLSFNSSTYFATVFKKYTMLTPSEYIARVKTNSLPEDSGFTPPEASTD